MYRILFILLLCSPMLVAQEVPFVPPHPGENATALANASAPLNDNFGITTRDSLLGDRIARVSADMESLPQKHGQIWREYDITPFTQGRNFPAGSPPPEQMLVDWIVRQTGAGIWNSGPFSILTASPEKLYVWHTVEVQLIIADIVDRFVNPQLWNETCTVRIVSISRPEWRNRAIPQMRSIPIATPGVQGWLMERSSAQSLLHELSRRNDFRELIPPQPFITHGIQHNVAVTRQRQYLRDVQANPAALHGFSEDRATIDEGIGLSITPLALLDGRNMAVNVKLDVIQIERMFTSQLEIATATNPRQRVQIESPQMAYFRLDEVVGFPRNQVLLLDLGTIPLPNTMEENNRNVLEEIARGINPARRGNVLVFIESTSGGVAPAVSSSPPANAAPVRTATPHGGFNRLGLR